MLHHWREESSRMSRSGECAVAEPRLCPLSGVRSLRTPGGLTESLVACRPAIARDFRVRKAKQLFVRVSLSEMPRGPLRIWFLACCVAAAKLLQTAVLLRRLNCRIWHARRWSCREAALLAH